MTPKAGVRELTEKERDRDKERKQANRRLVSAMGNCVQAHWNPLKDSREHTFELILTPKDGVFVHQLPSSTG